MQSQSHQDQGICLLHNSTIQFVKQAGSNVEYLCKICICQNDPKLQIIGDYFAEKEKTERLMKSNLEKNLQCFETFRDETQIIEEQFLRDIKEIRTQINNEIQTLKNFLNSTNRIESFQLINLFECQQQNFQRLESFISLINKKQYFNNLLSSISINIQVNNNNSKTEKQIQ